MSPALIILAGALSFFLVLVSFVQLLYLEAMRLRPRELPALEFFKDELEERIGLPGELGALSFSLIKHGILVMLGLLMTLISARGGPLTAPLIAEAALFGLALMIGCAYLAPQLLYRKTGGRWLLPLVPFIKLIVLLVRPLTALLGFLRILASLGAGENGDENGASTPEEDLEALIEAGADEGLIEEDDRKLIQSVVALGDKKVREVMTPRPKIVSISQDATIEDFRELAIHNHFSRIPVYEGTIDHIIGFVHVRDILKLDYDERTSRTVKELLHPTKFVPETKLVGELFREMQKDNIHMAIVIDEYGETAGIATMEDMMEEVFGEIEDEYDPKADLVEEPGGAYLLSGNVDTDELHELVGFRPDEDTESTTVGGLVSEWLGHVPAAGESVERDGVRFEVTKAGERQVEQVRVARVTREGSEVNSDRS